MQGWENGKLGETWILLVIVDEKDTKMYEN